MNPILNVMLDQRDERRARTLRDEFGRRRWILSWHPADDGRWLARLSCPELSYTIERDGRTRSQAIDRACASVNAMLALRGDFAIPARRFAPITEPESEPEPEPSS